MIYAWGPLNPAVTTAWAGTGGGCRIRRSGRPPRAGDLPILGSPEAAEIKEAP